MLTPLMDNPIVIAVAKLEPGWNIAFTPKDFELCGIYGYWHNEFYFSAADRVLENIVSSGNHLNYYINEVSQEVVFYRLESPNRELGYQSPDRR